MRALLLALAALLAVPASAQSLVGLTSCCPNEVVTVDVATGDTARVAAIGTANDLFVATVGSTVLDLDGRRAFLVRDGRVTAIDLDTGAVTETGDSPDFVQLAGFDAARGRLLGLSTRREDRGGDTFITNHVVGYDPATDDTTRIAEVGRYQIVAGQPSGDSFSTVTGPAVASPSHLYTVRNGALVVVDLATGATETSAQPLDLAEVVGVDAARAELYRTERSVTRVVVAGDTLDQYTARLLRHPVQGSAIAAADTVGVFGVTRIDREGNVDGPSYLASFGAAYYDAAGDRVLLDRNGELVEVALGSGQTAALRPSGRIRYVPTAAGAATAADPGAEAVALRLQVAPNPVAARVTVRLELGAASDGDVSVYDAAGRRVARLHRGPLAAGPHRLSWDARAAAPGVYLVRAALAGGAVSAPVTVLR